MYAPKFRRIITQISEDRTVDGRLGEPPLRKVVVAAVFTNPFLGGYVDDLSPAIDYSPELGTFLGGLAVEALGAPAVSYGKGGIAGVNGAQEHVISFITTPFGNALRDAVGGGAAWISSATVVGGPGTLLTLPLAHKDALYVRDNYDAVTLYPADAPHPDELLVAVAVANRGRIGARLGGLKAEEIVGKDGLS
ncbi:MAG TPA: peptide synthetase [Propionibacteriaceae bacterium]|nr:peptide synthetase [Propionibacteriaceae bacterium]